MPELKLMTETADRKLAQTDAAQLAVDEQLCSKCGQTVKKEAMVCRFCNYTLDPDLRRQHAEEEAESARADRLRKYVHSSAIGWLIVAVLQFVLSAFLSAAWGVVCLIMGAIGLAAPVRAMLLVYGCAMMLLGVANAFGTIAIGRPGFMTYLGVMQVVWGFKELKKFASGEVLDPK
jgi:hypothetical protein